MRELKGESTSPTSKGFIPEESGSPSPGIVLPLMCLPGQSRPAGEPRPGGDCSLELGSWDAWQPPLLALSSLSFYSQDPTSCPPSLSGRPQTEEDTVLLPPFREYAMMKAQSLPLKDTQCRVGLVGTAQGVSA